MLFISCCVVHARAEVVAKGDNFIIDSIDVEAQRSFFSEKGLESTDSEHVVSTLKFRLFALEAKEKGLIGSLPEATGPFRNQIVREYYQIFQIYVMNLMETNPVSEDAIKSYYLSYPEKFRLNQSDSKKYDSGQDLWQMDEGVKKWIRYQITNSQQVVIIQNEFDRLKNKYHAVIVR